MQTNILQVILASTDGASKHRVGRGLRADSRWRSSNTRNPGEAKTASARPRSTLRKKKGLLKTGTVIEGTSGNTGITPRPPSRDVLTHLTFMPDK